jgi:hypothetical protein
MLNKYLIINLFLLSILPTQAQEVITFCGGNISGNGGYASYTLGQVADQVHTSNSKVENEGVQQPYEISEQTVNTNFVVSTYTIYPNPTNNNLLLNLEAQDFTDLNFQIVNMQGVLVKSGKITGHQTTIPMDDLVSSVYNVTIQQSNKKILSFKIIKN